ncbi:MAG: WecB/TagA/CpsF family glycosyltransferase [Phycisphaerae bacterium]|nr:WecB/TagA/CpsF family glycosyltransferase [Phycisphaerae bacterium]
MRADDRPGGRRSVLGVEFDFIDDEAALASIRRWLREGTPRYVTHTNPYSVGLCHRDADMRRATSLAGLTLPDGVGIIWAANQLGHPHRGRVAGPSFMLKVCDRGREHGYRHFFYGGGEGVADRLAERLCQRFPGLSVAGTYCPPFRPLTRQEDDEIVATINQARPDVLWVGLGAPKQEKWMLEHVGRIDRAVMVGVGAAFDFHSGNVRWAPPLVRRLGLEWAYRLTQEPKRLAGRNIYNIIFAAKVMSERLRTRRHQAAPVSAKPAARPSAPPTPA